MEGKRKPTPSSGSPSPKALPSDIEEAYRNACLLVPKDVTSGRLHKELINL